MSISVDNEVCLENPDIPSPIAEYEWLLILYSHSLNPIKDCLLEVLYPIFVRIYLELLERNQVVNARRFFDCYSDVFPRHDGYEILEHLYSFTSVAEAEKHEHYKYFWNSKLQLKIPDTVKDRLILHFKQLGSKVILPILNEADIIEGEVPLTVSEKELASESQLMEKPVDGKTSFDPYVTVQEEFSFSDFFKDVSSITPNNGYNDLLNSLSNQSNNRMLKISDTDEDVKAVVKRAQEEPLPIAPICIYSISSGTKEVCMRFKTHEAEVTGMSFAPQHPLFVSCSLDKTVKVWSVTDLQNIETYKTRAFLWDIDVSLVHPHFVTAGADFNAHLYSFDSKVPFLIFEGHRDDVKCVKFHPTGAYLATASDDRTVCLWSNKDGHMARKFFCDEHPNSIAFSSDGKYVAVSYTQGSVVLWDLALAKPIHRLSSNPLAIPSAICFDVRENVLLVAYLDNTLKVWDVRQTPEDSDTSNRSSEYVTSCYSQPRSVHSIKYNKWNFFACITYQQKCLT